MALSSSVVGLSGAPITHAVDLRWVLAYSAGIGDTVPAVFGDDAVAHPVFPVCPEWPAVLSVRGLGLAPDEARRGVHASHDLIVHRPVRPGDVLTTTAAVVAVEAGRNGAATWLRLTTVDAAGQPVATTYQRNVFLGVPLDGEPTSIDEPPPMPEAQLDEPLGMVGTIPVGAQAAHVYTECAHIWNPIHTEWAAARAAGLPDLLLHGTATLAMAVSAVDDAFGGGHRDVARITCRFAAPVPMPSELTMLGAPDGRFSVTLADGTPVLRDGRVLWQ